MVWLASEFYNFVICRANTGKAVDRYPSDWYLPVLAFSWSRSQCFTNKRALFFSSAGTGTGRFERSAVKKYLAWRTGHTIYEARAPLAEWPCPGMLAEKAAALVASY